MIAGVSVGSILLGVAIAVGIVVIVVVTIKRVKPAYRRRKESTYNIADLYVNYY